jgi:transcriptional regulator with PAS, ATPase and Fis domain
MASILKQIQEYMTKYVDTIASVLNVDIEIVDDRLIRMSGSGIYKYKANESPISEGYIYNQVLHTGECITVLEVLDNKICTSCKKRIQCMDKTIIAVPIKYKNRTIGVIGAISTEVEKKREISEKADSYLEFINNISDLISLKVKEFENNKYIDKEIKMFRGIIDNIEKGLIILDENSKISYINNIAKKMLNIFDGIIGSDVSIKSIEKNERLSFSINERIYKAPYKVIPVHPYIKNYDKMIIFDEVESDSKLNDENSRFSINSIIGSSDVIKQVKLQTKRIAQSSSTVLITGESGTGKELIAKSIHSEGKRANNPFVAINCAAIPETLLESELFGYVKGAFSGANNEGKVGKFELANTGVIFLDEIGDLSLHLQAKLLRVLQERKLARIGSNKMINLDIRVIAATNQNILELVEKGKFREDLYYRLNVIPIKLPPLRERDKDVYEIFMRLLNKYAVEFDIEIEKIEESVIDKLINYNWPGNIRELENTVEYMVNIIADDGIISENMLPIDIINYFNNQNKVSSNNVKETNNEVLTFSDEIITIKELELKYINNLLDKYGRTTKSKKEIAKKLGIGVSTLYRKIDEVY